MNHNEIMVPCPSLHLVQLFNDFSDGGKVCIHPIRCPVGDGELGHFLDLGTQHTLTQYITHYFIWNKKILANILR